MKLLANIGCVDISNMERDGGDGAVTKLGKAVSKLPLGVRVSLSFLIVLVCLFVCAKHDGHC